MSERKPPGLSWQSWIDRQIEEGEKSGAFDELEGHGQPIRDLDRPHDDDWWIRAKLAREDVLVTPPTIAIRQDRDASIARAMDAVDETTVTEIIEDLNERIREVNRSATWGPPSSVAPLEVDSIVARWRTTGRGARGTSRVLRRRSRNSRPSTPRTLARVCACVGGEPADPVTRLGVMTSV